MFKIIKHRIITNFIAILDIRLAKKFVLELKIL